MAARHRLKRLAGTALAAAAGLSILAAAVILTQPAAAQFFFDDRFPFDRDYYRPQRPAPPADFSRAPAARKPDPAATTTVVVMGDSMADWLAHGLEHAFTDTPEVAIVRKHRTHSGLIRETRGDPPDWPVLAREILAGEKPAFVVMMIGHNDLKSIRERQPPRGAQPAAQPPAQPPAQVLPQAPAQATPPAPGQPNPGQPPAAAAEAAPAPAPAPATPAPVTTTSGATHEFRSEKWVELYTKRIDDTITALKSKGVPVLWVGLPAVRSTNAATDHVYLNELYKARAEKAGAMYVDVWDGFVDEGGRYVQQGPDFEGQTRRLRSGDGVHFTQAGARKLAHYVEREIRRTLTSRTPPIAVPVSPTPEEAPQPAVAKPGGAVQRPLAGPVLPLSTPSQGTENTLLGGGPLARPSADTPASKVIVRGEPVAAPAGRSDDFAWPRRGVAPPGIDPVATTTTNPIPVYQPPPPPAAAITPGARPAATADAPPPGRRASPRPPPRRQQHHDFFQFWR